MRTFLGNNATAVHKNADNVKPPPDNDHRPPNKCAFIMEYIYIVFVPFFLRLLDINTFVDMLLVKIGNSFRSTYNLWNKIWFFQYNNCSI